MKQLFIREIDSGRRSLIIGALGVGAAVAGTGITSIVSPSVKEFGDRVTSKVIGATEVARSVFESQSFSPDQLLKLISYVEVTHNPVYSHREMYFDLERIEKNLSFIECHSMPNILYDPRMNRLGGFRKENFGANFPLVQCKGSYHRSSSLRQPIIPLTSVRDNNGHMHGPNFIIDRFIGGTEEQNRFSGGIVIDPISGLKIVYKNELQEAYDLGKTYAQTTYAFSSNDKDELLEYTWTHHRVELPIASTCYWWGCIIQSENDPSKWGYLVNHDWNDLWSLYDISRAAELTLGSPAMIALTDGGNGSTAILTDGQSLQAIGVNGEDYHLTPISLQV